MRFPFDIQTHILRVRVENQNVLIVATMLATVLMYVLVAVMLPAIHPVVMVPVIPVIPVMTGAVEIQ